MPSSTVSLTSKPNNPAANVTLSHAQKLRGFLESLDGVQRERAQSVTRAKRQAQAEDITPRIVRAAAAVEQWTEVQPSMFEDVIDEALVKYDKYREDIEAGEQVQEVLLESITVSMLLYRMGIVYVQLMGTRTRNGTDFSSSRANKIHR